jgi:hypothetical protein
MLENAFGISGIATVLTALKAAFGEIKGIKILFAFYPRKHKIDITTNSIF